MCTVEDLKVGMKVTKDELINITGVYIVFDKDYSWSEGGTITFIGESIPDKLRRQMYEEDYYNFFYQVTPVSKAYDNDLKKALQIGFEVTLEELNLIRGVENLYIYLEMTGEDKGKILWIDPSSVPDSRCIGRDVLLYKRSFERYSSAS